MRGCAGVAATGGTRRAHNCIPVKDILMLVDSNYITLAQDSVLSFVTTYCVKIWYFANTSVKNQRTLELSLAESKCDDTGTNDSGILQLSLGNVEPVCFLDKPQGPPPLETAWVSCGHCSYRRENTA